MLYVLADPCARHFVTRFPPAACARREIELSKMLHVVGEYLSDMNAGSKKPQNLVLFQFALEHVARISAVVSQPGGGKQTAWASAKQ
jgi:hypothetical protein